MGDEKKEVKIDKNENVIIPYALFEKMLKNQEEMSERFCRLILIMFELLLDMYLSGKISESYLRKAVRVKWITEEEMEQIKLAKVEADKINVE